MSSYYDKMKAQLQGIKSAYELDASEIVEETIKEGMGDLKSRIKNFNIKTESVKPTPNEKPAAKFTPIQIADRMTATYKEKIRPEVEELERSDSGPQPATKASRTNMRAMAASLAGLRTSGNAGKQTQSTPNGNGDLGQYTRPANNNDGDLGNNTAYGQYYALTTSMTLEEYERHISEKFGGVEEPEPVAPLTCGVCACDPCECEDEYEPIEELKERLLQLEDTAWQSIDLVMREMARELEVTPKELHKHFKHETGQIPDDWLKENREIQLCGWMPLDEAMAINKIGMVYDVTCMWRGQTMRTKFFWPETTLCSKEQCQRCCEMLYPGSRLIAHYPSQDQGDNYMVVIPPMKESFEFVPYDSWEELDEETNELFQQICEEVGEPLTPPVELEDERLKVLLEDHDTGEEIEVIFEKKGLWDNIHAKRKRGEKPAKPGEKGYPPTLNVEEKNPCWDGYKRKKGTKKFAPGSCVKESEENAPNYGPDHNPSRHVPNKPGTGKLDPESERRAAKARKANQDLRAGRTEDSQPKITDKDREDAKKGKILKIKKQNEEYIPEGDEMKGMSQKSGDKRSTESGAGMTAQGVAKYNRRTGGNLKTAVTTPPSKLKPGSKAAGRRKSFCARSRGWTGERGKAARRRWNC